MKVQFFQDIGVRDDAIGNMLVKFPPLLTYSLHKKIRPVVCSFLVSSPQPTPQTKKKILLFTQLPPSFLPFPPKRREFLVSDFIDVIRELSVLISHYNKLVKEIGLNPTFLG